MVCIEVWILSRRQIGPSVIESGLGIQGLDLAERGLGLSLVFQGLVDINE